jgi:hypothetical protein
MTPSLCLTQASGDLFSEQPINRRCPATKLRFSPELAAARMLCRRLRDRPARPDKRRIAHLICLNLLSMLKRGPQRP